MSEEKTLYRLSSTETYHRQDLESLGWELTVSNALHPAGSPIRKILKNDASYGDLLYGFLSTHIPFADITKVLEIGGGYGYLMKDFLKVNRNIRPFMLDIAPALLKKQAETLAGHDVEYYLNDATKMGTAFFEGFDLVIFNENLGDFPTLTDVDPAILHTHRTQETDDMIALVRHFFDLYGLEKPALHFNLNIGAMRMLEKVCGAGVPYIFVGEHSCEWTMPPEIRPYFDASGTGNPRRIRLKGHDEYTIRFSYLEAIAGRQGYRVRRGPFADFIRPDINDYVKAVLRSRGLYSDSEEIICQFVGDLYEYEYLVLARQ